MFVDIVIITIIAVRKDIIMRESVTELSDINEGNRRCRSS